jgi:hypothetical protein
MAIDTLYEKCADCHLFVEPNDVEAHWELGARESDIAPYIHLHRGDEADEAIDESHEATPSGMKANLATWKAYGPLAMKRRFTS